MSQRAEFGSALNRPSIVAPAERLAQRSSGGKGIGGYPIRSEISQPARRCILMAPVAFATGHHNSRMQVTRVPTSRQTGYRATTREAIAAQRRCVGILSCAILASFALWPASAGCQELTPAEAEAAAREGYVYGFAIVENYNTMYAHAIDAGGEQYKAPLNTLKHEVDFVTPADTDVVTPDVDTLYSYLWMDLRTEPLVLGVPAVEDDRYYAIQLIDLHNFNFAYIGSRATGNGEGEYLITGPGWTGEAPEGIEQEIRSETDFALAIYRTQLRGPDDLERVEEIQAQYTVQPLSVFLEQPRPQPATAIEFPRPASTAEPDLSFFSTLSFLLQFCPPHPSERDARDALARIGVAAETPFDTEGMDPELQDALRRGIEAGQAAIEAAAATLKVSEVSGARDFLGNDYIKRAAGASRGRYSHSQEEALYPLYLTDADGEPLDASEKNYVLRLSEAELPPVNAFWSITMYDGESQGLVANAINRHRISSAMLPSLEKDEDGSLAILIQHESPTEERAANWLPAPDGPFYLVMRLYWPKPEAYDGTWTPPLIWHADSAPPTPVPTPAGAETAEEVKPSVLADEPKPEMERPAVWEEPTEVQVAIYVIDIDEVDSAEQNFAASVYVEAHWKNPFLRHKGPDPTHRELTDVWNPRLTIISQQTVWRSYPESVEIRPDGTVIYRQKIWGHFSQPLNLRDFPFDRQQLSIHVVAAGLMEKDVELVPLVSESQQRSDIATDFSLPDFQVASWSASPEPYYPGQDDVSVAGYEMKINVTRKATYYVLKVIIPLCLIVIMSWLPRWMDPEQSGTNIGVSTSAFLTLVAYLFAITVLLPRVSYVTRMDRFILLSTLMVFAGLIQTVANTSLVRRQKKRLAERIDRGARIIYPILLVLVLAVSFLI